MHVGMQQQILAPGVQHREEPEFGPQVLGIASYGEECGGSRTKEGGVNHALVLKCERTEPPGQGEDHVEVLDREQARRLLPEPFRPSACLALRTVDVPARIVRELLVVAVVALAFVPAERRRTADGNVSEGSPLLPEKAASVGVEELLAVAPKHIGHLCPLFGHCFVLVSLARRSLPCSARLKSLRAM